MLLGSLTVGASASLLFTLPPSSPHSQVSPFGLSTLAQSVISCVRLLCERLSFLEPPEVTEAVFNLRRACKTATYFEFETALILSDEVGNQTSR